MTLQEYKDLAKRTCPTLGEDLDELHMKMGIMTEIGEAVDIYKKHIAYGKDLDLIHIQEELSDACWYLVNDMNFKNESFEVLEFNPSIINEELDFSLKNIPESLMRVFTFYYNGEYSNETMIAYIWTLSEGLGLDFFKGLENNINKLKVRYPEKFNSEKALNRDLEAERKELEK